MVSANVASYILNVGWTSYFWCQLHLAQIFLFNEKGNIQPSTKKNSNQESRNTNTTNYNHTL